MPRVVDYEEAQKRAFYHVKNKGGRTHVPFLESSEEAPGQPTAFLSNQNPGRIIDPHYHVYDQFQLVVRGKGKLGRDDISPYYLHYTRAYTSYGPLVSDSEEGLSFYVLFSGYQPGAQYLHREGIMDNLKAKKDRKPWHVKAQMTFPSQEGRKPSEPIELCMMPGVNDGRGLFAATLAMAPDACTATPDPAGGEGQYVVALNGSFVYEGKEYKAPAVAFIQPQEGSFPLKAGSDGLEAAILNFPQSPEREQDGSTHKSDQAAALAESSSVIATDAAVFSSKKWECALCGFVYDEAKGMPEDGIPPGTHWADVPHSWNCPDCSATKDDFKMIEQLA